MSLPARTGLAIALAWAGGFAVLGGPAWLDGCAIVLVIAACVWARGRRSPTADEPRDDRLGQLAELVGLALLLGLLARALGRVVIASPAALWTVPVVGLALLLGRAGEPRRPSGATLAAVALGLVGLAAGLLGARFEAAAEQPRGAVISGPILGVHPRQAVGVRIDGFGPHDIVVDDYVDPPGGQGYDPSAWAERLELELRAIATVDYADGPARARAAFAGAEVRVVDAVVPPADLPHYESLLGIEVRSGTSGEGSSVEFVCPGQTLDPARERPLVGSAARACPRKYLVDGASGLGLASRWPGYTRVRGRDRARVARWLGWPRGEPRADRRSLALESGLWLVALVIGGWLLGRGRSPVAGSERAAAALGGVAIVGALLVAASESSAALEHPAVAGGATLLAIVLVVLPISGSGSGSGVSSVVIAGLIGLLAVSPLAGRGDPIALLDALGEQLVLGLDVRWSSARALAGSASVVALAAGVGICCLRLFERASGSEGRHTPRWLGLALALVVALALALRKPAEDLALLGSAAAVLIVAIAGPSRRAARGAVWGVGLALACSIAAALPVVFGAPAGPVATAAVVLATAAGLGLALRAPTSLDPGPGELG